MTRNITYAKRFFPPAAALAALAVLPFSTIHAQDEKLDLDPGAESREQPPTNIPLSRFSVDTGNLVQSNPGGEDTVPYPNLWDGVDKNNTLRVYRRSLPVLDEGGRMVSTSFPNSPNFVDMNDDGLKDLVMGSSDGFVWIYFNRGERGAPRFTQGNFLHTFVGNGSKIHVVDWDQDGDYDIISGTVYGDVVYLENKGTKMQMNFINSMGKPRYIFPRSDDRLPSWCLSHIRLGKDIMVLGNYLAPWVVDWNKDGKPDLLIGEGTYSANSVRLVQNSGAVGRPLFTPDRVFYLAYGEGFEHLTPAVLDYNADSLNDLIMGSRTGHFRMHKGTPKSAEGTEVVASLKGVLAPAILEFDKLLTIGGSEKYGEMSIAYPCDWNEDGLIDLLLGSQDGTVGMALNTGTAQEPLYGRVDLIKGVDEDKDVLWPDGWSVHAPHHEAGLYCNSAYLLTSERETPFDMIAVKPVSGERFIRFRYIRDYPGWVADDIPGARAISAPPVRLEKGKRYELSFHMIMKGRSGGNWVLGNHELVRPGTDTTPPVWEWQTVTDTISSAGGWQKRSKSFICPLKVQTNAVFGLIFYMPPGDCEFFIDDLAVRESAR